ncbi:MAG: hypothetical protein U9P71_03205 [Campylobacterota bacterium]|nr:hypothetical protein [Campylobacterota bacterium]
MNQHDLSDLREEFDKFVQDKCATSEDGSCNTPDRDMGDAVDDEPVPAFVEQISESILAPVKCGVYISRLDIKRVAEAVDESLPIKERQKMLKALFRHTTTQKYLEDTFAEFNRHINGRILIYEELSEAFPSSKYIFDANIVKIRKTQKIFDQIVEDYEEIEPTFDPMLV